ncbi:hypothetical protein CKC_05145 [Candidatus Liberibacter solanacearum CLso-ZC1]|uniref:Uncharacterized protein n=1 Tax=Liberibacter solanacearum (strain CLso-ZC1) TaxID=658172 RepID=E4UDU7_LIBSC|nr:hypothetical protein CKC_05145 [Candidatus Liberibacter solanacearum CLso-ZC1]
MILLPPLDLIDLKLFYSLWSMISGQTIGLPILNITKNIGVIPSMRLVLTSYAVLEKRFFSNFLQKIKK